MADLCDRLAVLADAHLVAVGDPATVRASAHPYVRELFHGVRAERVFARPEESP
jgi:phospholipid/cholesterol/gamma-HCH transport system ATP-binding protein